MTRFDRLIRSRRARVAIAASLAAGGLWAFAPYALGDVAGEAYVNAPLVRITTPIAGTVGELPEAGSYIAAPHRLRLVTARGLDTDPLGALASEAGARAAGRDLARRQLAEIAAIDARLAAHAAAYGSAAVARLAAGTVAATADGAACRAEADEALRQQARIAALAAKGFAAAAAVARADAAAAATNARCEALAARSDVAVREAGAARAGIYFGSSGMDTPYAEQQRDRLALRRQELESIVAEAEARLATLGARLAAERARLARAAAFEATLPGASVLWAVAATPGSTVAAGAPLLDLADCRHRFVTVALPERRMEAVLPGQVAQVRLIGGDAWQRGVVVRAAGAAARRDVAMVAADETRRDSRALSIEVALPPAPPNAAGGAAARRCDIGRLAEVRFPRWPG